jgi:C1A family cysteine protease
VKVDSGALIKDAITALSDKGAVEEDVWPYHAGEYAAEPPPAVHKARRFRIADAKLLHSLDDVKRALQQNGPVVAGITVFRSFTTAEVGKTGVIPMPTKKMPVVGGHAIVIVGYDDAKRRVKFVNSWGRGWGDQGFGYLPYEYFDQYVSDAWTFKLGTP